MNLLDYRGNGYSATGNDGIIEKILEIAGIKNGFFVEFGAVDGVKNANCRKLFEKGWAGFFIENDKNKFAKLYKNYKDVKNIIIANKTISISGKNSFDNIFNSYLGNQNIDFCSIDIDGLDIEVFESITKHLPKIVCIEGGQMLLPFEKRVDKSIAANKIQQPLSVMQEIFAKKGYKLLCSYQDSFFIQEHIAHCFDVSTDLMQHYLNGLLASIHRLPYIQKTLKEVGKNNKIVDDILEKTNYKKYKWDHRKKWLKENKTKVITIIKERIKSAN